MMYCIVGVLSTYQGLSNLLTFVLIYLSQGIIGMETEHGTLHIKVSAHAFRPSNTTML